MSPREPLPESVIKAILAPGKDVHTIMSENAALVGTNTPTVKQFIERVLETKRNLIKLLARNRRLYLDVSDNTVSCESKGPSSVLVNKLIDDITQLFENGSYTQVCFLTLERVAIPLAEMVK
jgi:hypothetical protein